MLEKGLDKIYNEDLATQKHYIDLICKDLRGRDLPIIYDLKAFYVPNNDYMIEYFGHNISNPRYDCYNYNGYCSWTHHLVIPVRDVMGKVVGFTGYNPYVSLAHSKELKTKEEEEISKLSRYKESSKILMDKSKFFIAPLGIRKAIEDKYIVVIDGVFDSISVANEGFNSLCILGSTVSEEVRFCLSFIETIYVAYDNDYAGIKLFNRLKTMFPNVLAIRQSKCKDIDGFIKQYPDGFNKSMQSIFSKVKTSILLEP